MSKFKRKLVTCLDDVGGQYVLNMTETAAILDLDSSTARDYCARGIILGAFQIGRNWRIKADDLRKHMDSVKLPLNEHVHSLRTAPRRRIAS